MFQQGHGLDILEIKWKCEIQDGYIAKNCNCTYPDSGKLANSDSGRPAKPDCGNLAQTDSGRLNNLESC